MARAEENRSLQVGHCDPFRADNCSVLCRILLTSGVTTLMKDLTVDWHFCTRKACNSIRDGLQNTRIWFYNVLLTVELV